MSHWSLEFHAGPTRPAGAFRPPLCAQHAFGADLIAGACTASCHLLSSLPTLSDPTRECVAQYLASTLGPSSMTCCQPVQLHAHMVAACCREGRYNLCPDIEFFATPPHHGSLMQVCCSSHSLGC